MRKRTQEDFIKLASFIHKNIYDYSLVEYKNIDTKVKIICPIHGLFEQIPYLHLKGSRCKRCVSNQNRKSKSNIEEFTNKANKIHNNKYTYDKTIYEGVHKKVIIGCKEHGEFKQTPYSHLSGYGCKQCGLHIRNEKMAEKLDKKLYIYLLSFEGNGEIFLKIGWTVNLQLRVNNLKTSGYNIKILCYQEMSALRATNTERLLLEKFKKYKYKPKLPLRGHTECFKIDLGDLIDRYFRINKYNYDEISEE